jgi:hydrogenase maturation factor
MPEKAQCDDDMTFCITCSDAAEPMRVESIRHDGSLGTCVDVLGHRSDVFLELVSDVAVGTDVLVHAGVALLKLAPPREAPPQ